MIKSLAIISLLVISFVPIYAEQQGEITPVYLEPQPVIYPALTSGISSVPNGYLYFYDFDMDTHNQTIAIDSVDFVINNTDTSSYDIGGSTIGIQGKIDVIPLSLLTWSLGDSTQEWSYNYTNNDGTQMAFIPDSKDQTAKFTLAMLAPFKVPYNLGVSIRVHYLTTDGQQEVVTSKWYDMDQLQQYVLTQGTNLCTEGFGCPNPIYMTPEDQALSPPQSYPLQGQDYYLIQTLNELIQQQNETNQLLKQQNYLIAFDTCEKDTGFQNGDGSIGVSDTCLSKLLGVSK